MAHKPAERAVGGHPAALLQQHLPTVAHRYSDEEARDDRGRWTGGGGLATDAIVPVEARTHLIVPNLARADSNQLTKLDHDINASLDNGRAVDDVIGVKSVGQSAGLGTFLGEESPNTAYEYGTDSDAAKGALLHAYARGQQASLWLREVPAGTAGAGPGYTVPLSQAEYHQLNSIIAKDPGLAALNSSSWLRGHALFRNFTDTPEADYQHSLETALGKMPRDLTVTRTHFTGEYVDGPDNISRSLAERGVDGERARSLLRERTGPVYERFGQGIGHSSAGVRRRIEAYLAAGRALDRVVAAVTERVLGRLRQSGRGHIAYPPARIDAPRWNLLIGRHGQTSDDTKQEDYATGIGPAPLTDLGRDQARQAGEFLRGYAPATIYASDTVRTRQTAEIIAALLSKTDTPIQVQFMADLRPPDVGEFTQQPIELSDQWIREKPGTPFPGTDESYLDWLARCANGFRSFVRIAQTGPILLITHSRYIWAIDWISRGWGALDDIPDEGPPGPGGIVGFDPFVGVHDVLYDSNRPAATNPNDAEAP